MRSVGLEGGQRDLYETVRAAMDEKVRAEIAGKGFARSQIVILDALLKLRQVCCDPRLLKSLSVNYVDAQWHLAESDDGRRQVVERKEAALKLLVAHQQFAETVEPTVAHLDHPAPRLLLGIEPLGLGLLASAWNWRRCCC